MRSARLFLPRCIILLMHMAMSRLPYLASGTVSRRATRARLGIVSPLTYKVAPAGRGASIPILALRPPLDAPAGRTPLAGAVLAAPTLPIGDTPGVEGAANDVVARPRQVAHTAASNEDDRVFLEAVAFARNVGSDLDAAGQPHPGDLPEGGVGLLRGHGAHLGAHTSLLRRPFSSHQPVLQRVIRETQGWRFGLLGDLPSPLPDQLIDSWQSASLSASVLKQIDQKPFS